MVGIRELKARLSEYLDRAAAGETIVVTDRGRAKAEIRPLSADARIEQLVREGRVTPPRRAGLPSVALLGLEGKRTIAEVLDEDRGD
ncbi:MAG TPA: type II toxin-antitoxin system prevent-host-death family antitoxin [Gaiellaceae bacterium]|nr:type II toxin-antitoxin system prevent-host-death family antitoxin [Gaiellaceae bacterium]